MLKKLLTGTLLLALGLFAISAWVLLNPDRYRAELSSLLSQKTGWQIDLGGPLDWQFSPRLQLTARNIHLQPDDTPDLHATIKRLRLQMSIGSLLGLSQTLQIRKLSFENFNIAYTNPQDEAEQAFELLWQNLTFSDVVDNNQAHLEGDFALGRPASEQPTSHLSGDFNALRWQGDFLIDKLISGGATLQQIRLKTRSQDGRVELRLASENFFQGQAKLDLSVNTTATPWHWQLQPELNAVQTQPLLNWLGKDLNLEAALDLSGSLRSLGNALPELMEQANGAIQFDAEQGHIDVSRLQQEALELTRLAGGSDTVERWPKRLAFQTLNGNWILNGTQHELTTTLDNLQMKAAGSIYPLDDRLDMHATLTFTSPINSDSKAQSFEINPALMDLPFPVDCTGRLSKPRCKVDRVGVTRMLGDAVKADSNSELRKKLERRIEEEVPEAYQDAAKALLDSLGDFLGNDN